MPHPLNSSAYLRSSYRALETNIWFVFFYCVLLYSDRLCGLVVRVLGYRSGGPGFDSRHYKKKVVGLERGPLSLMSTTEELLGRKVVAPV
jgi:hypothetical protein